MNKKTMVTLEEWKAAMLARAPSHPERANYAPGWRRRALRVKVGQLRWRLAGWVAGCDLDDR